MFPFLKALAALSGILHSKVHMPLQNSVCSCSFKVFLIQALHARARVEEGGLLRGRTRDAHSKLSNIRLHTNRKRCSLSTQAQSFASQILITCSHHTLHTSHHTRARARYALSLLGRISYLGLLDPDVHLIRSSSPHPKTQTVGEEGSHHLQ